MKRRGFFGALCGAIAGLTAAPFAVKATAPKVLKFNSHGMAELHGGSSNPPIRQLCYTTGTFNRDWFMGHAPQTVFMRGCDYEASPDGSVGNLIVHIAKRGQSYVCGRPIYAVTDFSILESLNA